MTVIGESIVPPGPVAYPPGTPEYDNCTGQGLAAANLAETIRNDCIKLRDAGDNFASGVTSVMGILATLTLILAAPVELVALAILLAVYWGAETVLTLSDYYDEVDWNAVRDMLWCNMDCSGAMTEGGKTQFWNQLAILYPDNLLVIGLIWIIRAIPVATLNERAAIPATDIAPANSSDFCGWRHVWGEGGDRPLDTDWSSYVYASGGIVASQFIEGLGWTEYQDYYDGSWYRAITIGIGFAAPVNITKFSVEFFADRHPENWRGSWDDVLSRDGTSNNIHGFLFTHSSGNRFEWNTFVDESLRPPLTEVSSLWADIHLDFNYPSVPPTGHGWIYRITIDGYGDDPF
jgi:hypothetical protein